MKIKYVFLFILTFFSFRSVGQALTEGETLPVKVFNDVWNYKHPSINLDDFRGKYIVLDFWGNYCASCLALFPFIQKMQDEFEEDIQFIAVNSRMNVDEVGGFFKERAHLKPADIPYITNDTLLRQYFPHQGMPFYVILDREGKFVKKADKIIKSSATFEKILKNDFSNTAEDARRLYVRSLFSEQWDHLPIFASYILRTPASEGLRIIGDAQKGKGVVESGTIEFLYKRAYDSLYPQIEVFRPGRVVLEVNCQDNYRQPGGLDALEFQNWADENIYTYVGRFPPEYNGDIFKAMREDLQRYFGLRVNVERRKVPHLVLEHTSDGIPLKSAGGEPINTLGILSVKTSNMPFWRQLVNQPFDLLSGFIGSLTEYGLKSSFLDQTNINYNIDIKLRGSDWDKLDLGSIRKSLKQYGLDLVPREIEIDVLVIRE